MHKHSLEAYRAIEPTLPASRHHVAEQIRKHGPITRQEIAEDLRVPINQVTGRVTELLDAELIHECGVIKSKTGRSRALLAFGGEE